MQRTQDPDLENYILVGTEVIQEPDPEKWRLWVKANHKHRHIKRDEWNAGGRTYKLSTIFLEYDRNYDDTGELHLFETALFYVAPGKGSIWNPGHEEVDLSPGVEVYRCGTHAEALANHQHWLEVCGGKDWLTVGQGN
jgi:hypothetical protein